MLKRTHTLKGNMEEGEMTERENEKLRRRRQTNTKLADS